MKRIQYLLDQALRTTHLLEINIDVMEELQQLTQRTQELDSQKVQFWHEMQNGLQTVKSEHRFLRKNISSIVARATVLSNQVCASAIFLEE